jgi:hypothetical protein
MYNTHTRLRVSVIQLYLYEALHYGFVSSLLQARIQKFSLEWGGAHPEAIYNLYLILKIIF